MMHAALPAMMAAVLSTTPGDLPLLEPLPRWELGAAVGGGWDSNPLAATDPAGSGFGSARAWVGRRFELSGSDDLRLELHYDAVRYGAAPAADLDRPELTLGWDHAFGDTVLLRVASRAALRFQGDAARSGWDASGRASLRFALADRVGLRLGLGAFHREADDSAYGGSSGRGDVGVDLGLWRGASAVAGWALEVGAVESFSSSSGRMSGRTGPAGIGAAVFRQTLSADLLQDLGGGLFLEGGYGYWVERAAGTSADAHTVLLEAGWRR